MLPTNWMELLVSFVGGGFFALLVLALFVPDRTAVWFVSRRNAPLMLLPFGVVAFGFGLLTILWGLSQIWSYVTVSPLAWLALAFGGIVLVLWFATRRR